MAKKRQTPEYVSVKEFFKDAEYSSVCEDARKSVIRKERGYSLDSISWPIGREIEDGNNLADRVVRC